MQPAIGGRAGHCIAAAGDQNDSLGAQAWGDQC
jgi:hypothetical protein